MKHTVALITTLLLLPLTTLHAVAAVKPNILHIHADDHRADGLRALGTPLLQTPHLDSLVERGMTFTHCYTVLHSADEKTSKQDELAKPDRVVEYKKVGDTVLHLHVFNPTGHKASTYCPPCSASRSRSSATPLL